MLRLGSVVGAIALVAAALVLPSLFIGPDAITDSADRAQARNALRTAAVQGLGVLAVVLAGWYTARTYRLGREGQLTERFKAGVEMLGGGSINTAGGMLALERVARDSPRDHLIVIELLAMYARDFASSQEELRAILLIIGRRELRYDLRGPLTIDLTRLDAQNMRLVDLNLEGVDLSGSRFDASLLSGLVACRSRLERAQLTDADLQGARLDDANLTQANLQGAILAEAKVRRAELSRANLTAAVLLDGDLRHANLSGANLTDAQLHGAKFAEANLEGAILRRCSCSPYLEPPDFRSSNLSNARAHGAVLPRADFRGADLRDAGFDDAILLDADFRGAKLDGASFINASLTGSRRNGATGVADVTGATGAGGW